MTGGEELFTRMCHWDDEIAGIYKTDESGLLNNHAYSVIDCFNDCADTPIDLLKIQNPWGRGEIEIKALAGICGPKTKKRSILLLQLMVCFM